MAAMQPEPAAVIAWRYQSSWTSPQANTPSTAVRDVETGARSTLDVKGLFVAIGHRPNTDLFTGVLDTDENGYLITAPDSSYTNIEGVFACGDVQDHTYRQAITAAGSGCMAAIDAERWLEATLHAQNVAVTSGASR